MPNLRPVRLWSFGLALLWGYWTHDLWQAWFLTPGIRHGSPVAWGLAGSLLVLNALLWVGVALPHWVVRAWVHGLRWRQRLGHGRWLLLALWVLLFPYLTLFSPGSAKVAFTSARWMLYLTFAGGAAFFLSPSEAQGPAFPPFLQGLLLVGSAFTFASAYTLVSSYPFSLSWSEGNRLWDYSLMFARHRYRYPPDQPIFAHIDPGRQFLWGLVYLLPGVGIFGVRLWSAFLFSVPYLGLTWAAFWRPRALRPAAFWSGLWGFLFLQQGPIYTPLLLCALLVLLAEGTASLGAGLLLMFLAGYFATLSRFTWALAPPLWLGLLRLGQGTEPRPWRQTGLLAAAALLGAGASGNGQTLWNTGLALLHRLGVPVPSPAPQSTALAAQQPLLWARLWPNPTFPLGLVLGLLVAVAPLLLLWGLWQHQGLWHLPRWALGAVGAILLVLLGMGFIASLKIGGGNNLHNFDMFLIALLLFTAALWRQGKIGLWLQRGSWPWGERMALLLAVGVPMLHFLSAPPHPSLPRAQWAPALTALRAAVSQAREQGGEILFMDQRQLLTFGFVEGVPLVPEYEKKYLMDKAMAGDATFFARYYHDLAEHRFALIVTEPFIIHYEGGEDFASENNAWMKWVVEPTLCFYRPLATFKHPALALLVPRQTPQPGCLTRLPVPPAP